jgi:cellulose synthase/poly-beta-1,6-N-acetylglucosamine synthase-like glycosyltransferase
LATLQTIWLALLLVILLVPGFYGLHLFLLAVLAEHRRHRVRAEQERIIREYLRCVPEEHWPRVTTQIPLYNEQTVARRVIEAAARMDYPPERHEIQILDDSSDGTREIVDRAAAELRERGYRVEVVRRDNREHYKAGALAHGLKAARGEFIAIFDADFLPGRNFLRRLVPLLASDPLAACVQARWGHLNARESWLTEALALGIDGHFCVEQTARAGSGLLFNFNGTAGIWRRAAIEDPRVGGWQGDTITEDLDLSYRAQLAGWKMIYCGDEAVPAEIPADVNALKAQQRRWATGSIQTARKLLPAVWRSRLSLLQKLEASFHLTQYSVNLFMVLTIGFGRALLELAPAEQHPYLFLGYSSTCVVAAAGSWFAYLYARWTLPGGDLNLLRLVKLIVLGLGLSVNNSVAVVAGLFQRGGEFVRTPKSGARDGASAVRQPSPYLAIRSGLWLLELLIGGLCLLQWAWFLREDSYFEGTFLLLYAVGLIMMGWASRPGAGRSPPTDAHPASPPTLPAPAEGLA